MRRAGAGVLALVFALVLLPVAGPKAATAQPSPLRPLGEYSIPSRGMFQDTTVGGLSGISYDPKRGVFYVVSDDRGELQAPRLYTLHIEMDLSGITSVQIVGVTTLDSDLNTAGIQPYERNESDMEEIVLLPNDELLIASERDRNTLPWIRRFALDGTLLGELPMPAKFQPVFQADASGRNTVIHGIRGNFGFEGMTLTPDAMTMYIVNEEALGQDGPIATVDAGTNVRIVRYDLDGRVATPGAEYVYPVDKVFAASTSPNVPADNGVSAILWVRHVLPGYDLLVMERAFAVGSGNDINIYGVVLGEADDVSTIDALPTPFGGRMVQKTLLANIPQVGLTAENYEGMTLGPTIPNGKSSLLLISDDNFSTADPPQLNTILLLFELSAD